jgi:acetyl-CoA carboxylase biotin carboxyl carrier protein
MARPVSSAPTPVAQQAPTPPAAEAEEEGLATIKSPIVGTFYEAASPGSPPFVKPGDSVQPGKVLCIIESMKLMNEIEAEDAGVIMARLVENGSPVEYGQALFTYRPA